jgi:hypothetical protein
MSLKRASLDSLEVGEDSDMPLVVCFVELLTISSAC